MSRRIHSEMCLTCNFVRKTLCFSWLWPHRLIDWLFDWLIDCFKFKSGRTEVIKFWQRDNIINNTYRPLSKSSTEHKPKHKPKHHLHCHLSMTNTFHSLWTDSNFCSSKSISRLWKSIKNMFSFLCDWDSSKKIDKEKNTICTHSKKRKLHYMNIAVCDYKTARIARSLKLLMHLILTLPAVP